MRHTHYDVQLSYPSQTAGIRMYNKYILDNFIGSQAGPLHCGPSGMVRLTDGSVHPCHTLSLLGNYRGCNSTRGLEIPQGFQQP